jgi:hypothetical protein
VCVDDFLGRGKGPLSWIPRMDVRRIVVPLLVLVFVGADVRRAAHAQCGRGTLMQWSYGTSFEGGPNLNEPLITDRPDFTESSVTVGLGVVQIESGYTFTNDDSSEGHTNEHSFPETLFRIGALAEWFELRIGWNWGESAETVFGAGDENLSGAEDLYLGIKLALTPQECCLPETGLIVQMNVPTGSRFRSAAARRPIGRSTTTVKIFTSSSLSRSPAITLSPTTSLASPSGSCSRRPAPSRATINSTSTAGSAT